MEVNTSPADTFVIAAQKADAPRSGGGGRLSYKGAHLVFGGLRLAEPMGMLQSSF